MSARRRPTTDPIIQNRTSAFLRWAHEVAFMRGISDSDDGCEPTMQFRHQPQTGGFPAGGNTFVWQAVCRCGWRGPRRSDEYSADRDVLDHTDGGAEPRLSDGFA